MAGETYKSNGFGLVAEGASSIIELQPQTLNKTTNLQRYNQGAKSTNGIADPSYDPIAAQKEPNFKASQNPHMVGTESADKKRNATATGEGADAIGFRAVNFTDDISVRAGFSGTGKKKFVDTTNKIKYNSGNLTLVADGALATAENYDEDKADYMVDTKLSFISTDIQINGVRDDKDEAIEIDKNANGAFIYNGGLVESQNDLGHMKTAKYIDNDNSNTYTTGDTLWGQTYYKKSESRRIEINKTFMIGSNVLGARVSGSEASDWVDATLTKGTPEPPADPQ